MTTVTYDPEKWQLVPRVPTRAMIAALRDSEWPEDWERAKQLQRKHGIEVIPPETNAEVAAGQYVRMLSVAPKHK